LLLTLSVCHAAPSDRFSMWHSTKRCSSIFDLCPLTPKIYSPKICNCTKSPISRLVWQIDWRCFHLPWGFRGCSIQWNHEKCGAQPADRCCHGNIWARCGEPIAYRLMLVNFLFWPHAVDQAGYSSVFERILNIIVLVLVLWYYLVYLYKKNSEQ